MPFFLSKKEGRESLRSAVAAVILFLLLPVSYSPRGDAAGAADDPYGGTSPGAYLTGRFDPSSHPLFVSLESFDIPLKRRGHYLRAEAARALERLCRDYLRRNPGGTIWVQSSTRNFSSQKYIWEEKWTGRRPVGGEKLNLAFPDPLKRARVILRYSSMPGTSRHHWGTDVDFNILRNDYYDSGEGKRLFAWLVRNAGRYGFHRPYTAGRKKGYCEEKWHWSWVPLSRFFLEEWNRIYEENSGSFSRAGLFAGSEHAGRLAPEYVNGIAGDCR